MRRRLAGRRAVALVTLSAAILAGLVAVPAAASGVEPEPVPVPVPVPTSTSSAPEKPPIAPMPPGSQRTGSLVGVRADDGAAVIAEKWLGLRGVDLTIDSPAVGSPVVTRVLIPGGWSQASPKTYPLVLMLHGADDDYTSWTRETTIADLSSRWGVIVAMPDAGRWASYTNFFNGGKGGTPQWETFHTVELRQILERGLHASTTSRAVEGLSAGGYGALIYAARNPGMFRFAGSFSAIVTTRISPMREALLAENAVAGYAPDARWGLPLLNEGTWAAWDPYTQAAHLGGTSLYLASGYTGLPAQDDTVAWNPIQAGEVLFGKSAVLMSIRLSLLGIPHTLDAYALGEHAWVSWQRELVRSWPQMMTALGAKQLY